MFSHLKNELLRDLWKMSRMPTKTKKKNEKQKLLNTKMHKAKQLHIL